MKLQGTYTALVTPFTSAGLLDEEGFRKNIRAQIAGGITGIVPLGTTGETPTLTSDEQKRVLKISIEEAKGKVQIIVGTGTNSTATTIEKTLLARDAGADAALIVTPYYNKPTQAGILKHFEMIDAAFKFPFVVYNIPGRTGTKIETSTLKKIAELPGCIGVKEATGDVGNMNEVISEIASKNPRFQVLSGDDALTLPLIAMGGKGVISVISNLVPREYSELVQAALDGDFKKAQALQLRLSPLYKALFLESNPIPAKYGMGLLGLAAGPVRMPLSEISAGCATNMKAVLSEAGFLKS